MFSQQMAQALLAGANVLKCVYTLKDISASQERHTHLRTSAPAKSACAIC